MLAKDATNYRVQSGSVETHHLELRLGGVLVLSIALALLLSLGTLKPQCQHKVSFMMASESFLAYVTHVCDLDWLSKKRERERVCCVVWTGAV